MHLNRSEIIRNIDTKHSDTYACGDKADKTCPLR